MAYIQTRMSRFGSAGYSRPGQPLTDEEIARVAPSVFATEKHASRSDRFAYIPTVDVLAGLRREGFSVVQAMQGGSRIEGKAQYTKHLLRLRHESYQQQDIMGGVCPEVVLLNAHDGTSSYRAMCGIFRMICRNGLITMEAGGQDLRVPHTGDVVGRVIEGSFRVIEDGQRAITQAREWEGVTLSADESQALADAAHTLRFGTAEPGQSATPIAARQLLAPRRSSDIGNNLWLTHNVIQENAIRGGLRAWARDANNRPRRVSSREVKSVDGTVSLNRALWQLSAKMAELKGAA